MVSLKKTLPFFYYVAYYAAMAALIPFIVVYYQKLGFTGAQIGALTAIGPLISLAGGPVLSWIADATRRYKLVFLFTSAVPIVAGILFPFLRVFWPLLALVVVYSFLSAPIASLADMGTMVMLGDNKDLYGRIRVGGTLGWMISAPLVGLLVQNYGIAMPFWSYAALMFAALLLASRFHFPREIVHTGQPPVSMKEGTRILLSSRRWALFLSICFTVGVGLAAMNNFFYPLMNELKSPSSLTGLGLSVANVCEIPVMFFSNRLLKRFGSSGVLLFGACMTVLRLALYAVLPSPTAIVVSQLMNGLTFPMFWVGGVSYAYEHAPAGMAATGQGLLGAMIFGFGAAAGNFIGGLLLTSIGPRSMFLVFAGIVIAGIAIVQVAQRLLPAEKGAAAGAAQAE